LVEDLRRLAAASGDRIYIVRINYINKILGKKKMKNFTIIKVGYTAGKYYPGAAKWKVLEREYRANKSKLLLEGKLKLKEIKPNATN
jgi:hypothetical protein